MKCKKIEGPLETAVRLLAARDHTIMELRLKLHRKNISCLEVDEVIERLRDIGYLDDEKIKQRTIERMVAEKRYGARGIMGKLNQMGLQITKEEVRESYPEEAEGESARQMIQKHFRSIDIDTFPRVARFLANRGFSPSVINRLAEECRKHQ